MITKKFGGMWLRAKTQAKRNEIEQEHGSRFSQLSLLPYFDCVEFIILDPMHNLFEGTAKRVLKKIWLNESNPLLKSNDTSRIHSVIEQFKTPSSVGRLPRKIISGYSSFTADQWKSWMLWFSLLACHASLRKNDYECWQQFVLGCSILCSSVIAKNDLKVADEHLLKFCEKFQHLYGKKMVSPNMHYHMHLSKCIENYGPIQVFWLFSFERYNGILGSYHTNQRAIEIQVMRKFCRDMTIKTLAYSEPEVEMHKQLFCTVLDDKVTAVYRRVLQLMVAFRN